MQKLEKQNNMRTILYLSRAPVGRSFSFIDFKTVVTFEARFYLKRKLVGYEINMVFLFNCPSIRIFDNVSIHLLKQQNYRQ